MKQLLKEDYENKVVKQFFTKNEIEEMEKYVFDLDPNAYYTDGTRRAVSEDNPKALLKVSSQEAAKQIIKDAKAGVPVAYRYCFYYSIPVVENGYTAFYDILEKTRSYTSTHLHDDIHRFYMNTMYLALEHQLDNFNIDKISDEVVNNRTALDIFTFTVSKVIRDKAKEEALNAITGGGKVDGAKAGASKMVKVERDSLSQGGDNEHSAADSLLDQLDMEINNKYNLDGATSEQEKNLFDELKATVSPMDDADMQNWEDCVEDEGWLKNNELRGSLLKTLVNDMIEDPNVNGEAAFLDKHKVGIRNRQTARNYLGMNPGGYNGETINSILAKYDLDQKKIISKIVFDANKNQVIREPVLKKDGTQLMLPKDDNDPKLVPIYRTKKPDPIPAKEDFENIDAYNKAINDALSTYEKVKKDSLLNAADKILGPLPGNVLTEAFKRYCLRMAEKMVYDTDKVFRESIEYNRKVLAESKKSSIDSKISAYKCAIAKINELDESKETYKEDVKHILETAITGGIQNNKNTYKALFNVIESEMSSNTRRTVREVLN